MAAAGTDVLSLNAGSSSVKFAVDSARTPAGGALRGKLDHIGRNGTTLSWRAGSEARDEPLPAAAGAAGAALMDWIEKRPEFAAVAAIGHRVVHGLARTEPARVTPELLEELRRAVPYAPEHLPAEIGLIEAVAKRHPDLPQVACFDTAFHQGLPGVAQRLPIPRRYQAQGVRRYGFHGLSFAYLVEELERVAGPQAAQGRLVLAHLGNGSSLAAVRGGASVDTSMGFTPAAGLVMGTRSGDLDPGLVSFLARSEGMSAERFDAMVNHESGLLGVSETSSDMRDLLARERSDPRAAEAVALFCYQAKKWIGAFAAALGGLETLVFSAGIGERSAPVRARICDGLGFLGIEIDATRNAEHAPLVSADGSRVAVRVIPTDEERMVARSVRRVLGLDAPKEHNP
jgi:acetate kinase